MGKRQGVEKKVSDAYGEKWEVGGGVEQGHVKAEGNGG